MPFSYFENLRAELDAARAALADWQHRGGSPFEKTAIDTRIALAEAAVANAIGTPDQTPPARHAVARGPGTLSASDALALDRETDARFWVQTGVKPGHKLDPKLAADKAMMPVWIDIYAKVKSAWQNGTITWTYDHPAVTVAVADAHAASSSAAANLDAAIAAHAASDLEAAKHHLAQSEADHAAAAAALAQATQHQPPTVSPELVRKAAHEIRQFVMNGGVGVPVGSSAGVIGVMQTQAAPALSAAVGDTPADPDVQAHFHKFSGAKTALIAGAIVAALGLTAYTIEHHAAPAARRWHKSFRRTYRQWRRA